jgi:type II secretory pathway pseudopilin PulG
MNQEVTPMHRRSAFTLIEMIVAMALTLFIMVILAQAFVTGLETFRMLKGIGDMQQGLRTATLRLRSDLSADHFEAGRKLSDPNFWGAGDPWNPIWWGDGTPRMGFFRIVQNSASVWEGNDPDGLPSYRATNHALHFTIRLRGNHREGFLSASVPANSPLFNVATTFANQPPDARFQDQPATYTSAWGEIAYFLAPQGTTVEPHNPSSGAGGTPLFSLYRVQKVVVADSTQINAAAIPANQYAAYAEISCEPDPTNTTLIFNSPLDLAGQWTWQQAATPPQWTFTPPRRSITTYAPGPGASKLLENVVSFQVQVLWPGSTTFQDVPNGNFDTSSQPPPGYTITAIQITLRVWDPATQQTRQVTFIQDT